MRQYLYFCTNKASKLSGKLSTGRQHHAARVGQFEAVCFGRQHRTQLCVGRVAFLHTSADVSIRPHTSAYVSFLHDEVEAARYARYISIRQHTSAYASIR